MKRKFKSDFRPLGFLLWWVCSSVGIWPIGLMLSMFIFVTGAVVLLLSSFLDANSLDFAWVPLVTASVGMGAGLSAGYFQEEVLREDWGWYDSHWLRWTVCGAVVAALSITALLLVAAWVEGISLEAQIIRFEQQPLLFLLAVLIFSGVQWLALRRVVHVAWLWMVGNLAAASLLIPVMYTSKELVVLHLVSAIFAHSFINAIVLIWLYRFRKAGFIAHQRELRSHAREVAAT